MVIRAIYKNGVFKPLEKSHLKRGRRSRFILVPSRGVTAENRKGNL